MLSQIVKIIPKVGKPELLKVETAFNRSFKRVSKGFGTGLKLAGAFAAFQIAGNLTKKLAEPLDKANEKVKSILDQGRSYTELADQYGTSAGTIRQIEDTARLQGVSQENVRSMMSSFFNSVRSAQQEVRDPRVRPEEYSDNTRALQRYVDREDLGKAFIDFIGDLRAVGRGSIARVDGQAVTNENPIEARRAYERMILGGEQYGSARRFIEADFAQQSKRIGYNPEMVNRAQSNIEGRVNLQNELETRNQAREFIRGGSSVTDDIIKSMENQRQREENRILGDIENYKNIKAMADTLNVINDGMTEIMRELSKFAPTALDYMKQIRDFMVTVTNKVKSWWR